MKKTTSQIGKKINNLRKKEGLTQANLYPDNPSQISQIESGQIQHPTEVVLRIISQNLGISFDKLIEGTDWNPNQGTVKSVNHYAFSTEDFSVSLDKNGQIKVITKSYPAFNEDGNPNLFCPKFGSKLISSCKKCDRAIESSDSKYCIGCGTIQQIGPNLDVAIENLLSFIGWEAGLTVDISTNQSCQDIIHRQIKFEGKWHHGFSIDIGGEIGYQLEPYRIDDCNEDQSILDTHHFEGITKEMLKKSNLTSNDFTVKEWNKRKESSNPFIVNAWKSYEAKKRFFKMLLIEIKKYESELLNAEIHIDSGRDTSADEKRFHLENIMEAQMELRSLDISEDAQRIVQLNTIINQSYEALNTINTSIDNNLSDKESLENKNKASQKTSKSNQKKNKTDKPKQEKK